MIQLEVCKAIVYKLYCDGEDSFFLAPTSLGKALVFQLPAVMMEGTTLVISPLLALQADQTTDLNNRGIKAACLNGTTGKKDTKRIMDSLRDKTLKLLYIAPETLLKEELLEFLQCVATINHIAIDEAHALSQSSQDFRPKYRQLLMLREYFPEQPYTALTATATIDDIEEIIISLGYSSDFNMFTHNLHRDNLKHNVLRKVNELPEVMELLQKYPKGTSGIIYCNTKAKCSKISEYINRNGYKSEAFFSTVTKTKKKQILETFLSNDVDIVVATSAFGTGINKPNIRFIINVDIPSSMNDLLQQCGRAGRDGLDSDTYVLYSPDDVGLLKYIFKMSFKSIVRLQQAHKKLDEVVYYLNNRRTCRSKQLLNAYGQDLPEGQTSCGGCDVCKE